MKNIIVKCLSALFLGLMSSCSDYLDLVPDNVATLDDAFETRNAAEKYLFTCFHYLPEMMDPKTNPAILGSDECWWNLEDDQWHVSYEGKLLAQGLQTPTNPLYNYWDGGNGGTNLWVAINNCNTFLENIDKPYDLQTYEKIRWIAEVKFLKAYYHFFLFQLYGPIPIMDKNLPVSSSPEEVRVYRNTVDEVVDYICNLLDEAKQGLPLKIQQMTTDAGRPTQAMCLALKAKVLTLAASPLFNGNPDYEGYKDNRGVNIFGDNVGTVDMKKWERAATALKNAIDTCHLAENRLYEYVKLYNMSDTTALKLTLRGCVTEKWNQEIIWGATSQGRMSARCMPHFEVGNIGFAAGDGGDVGFTLKSIESFYSNHGVPIEEDKDYDYANRYLTRVAKSENELFDHRYYIQEGETTANLHFNREPRFYAAVGFDRGIFEGAGITDDTKSWYLKCRKGEPAGYMQNGEHIPTGFYIKKLINYETAFSNTNLMRVSYSFPIIRLADLYLLYAEVLNEIKSVPDEEVYYWVDLVRKRAGLEGVVDSWEKYSSNPTKPASQYGMREIIHQERNNEFMGEFVRYWDQRRWKTAVKEYNLVPIQGWNYVGETVEDFYNIQTYYNQRVYSMKDYLWPLSNSSILRNPNLVQNPGWNN